MKKYNNALLPISSMAIFAVLGFVLPGAVHAATAPNLGAASSFSILSQTALTNIPTSAIAGDVGMNASAASITGLTTAEVAGTIFATDLIAPSEDLLVPSVQTDASAVYTVGIPGLPIEGTPIAVSELNGITRGPGVYDLAGAAITLSGGILTLDGPGVYIFRTPFALTVAGTVNLINGAQACNVFWYVGSLATINSGGVGTSFAGTILSGTGVHFGTGAVLDGRALAIGGDVTLGSNTISGPTCVITLPPVLPEPVAPSPSSSSGGSVPRPIIHIEKTATPDALPAGPGIVEYSYAVSNAGRISINNVTISDDKCSDIKFISGDSDEDVRLDRDEVWDYECRMKLTKTTTNIVTATGESSFGKSTKDTDEVTVAVGMLKSTAFPLSAASTTVPKLPNTGIAPQQEHVLFGTVLPISLIALLMFSILRRQQLLMKEKSY